MSSTYSFPSYIFDSHTGAASTPHGLHDTVNGSCVDPTTLRWEIDSKDERLLSLSVGPNQSIPTSRSSRSSKSRNHHLLEVSDPDRLGSLSPLSEYIEIRGVPVRVLEGDVEVEIEGLDTELALLDDQHNESLINFSFSDWSAASNISQKSFHSRFLKSLQPLPPLELRVATILLDPQLSPLNKTKSRPSEPDITKYDQYDLAKQVEVEVEGRVEVVGMDSAPCLKGPRIDCRFWGDDNENDNGDNNYVTVSAVENNNSDRNHHVVSATRNECNSRILDPLKNTYSMKIRAEDSELDSSNLVSGVNAEMSVEADVMYQESCMYDCPLPQAPITPLQMYSLMPVRADMLSNMTAYSHLDGDNSSILNLLEWSEYNSLMPLPPPPNSVIKESQKKIHNLDESMKWNDTWNTDKSTTISQSNLSCMRYDKLPSSLDISNLSDAQPLIWNDIAPSMSSNTSSYPEDIISATSSRAMCVQILTDKSSPRVDSCCRSDDNTICVDRNNRYRDTICFKNDDNLEADCIPVSQATFVRSLVTTLVTGFQSIAVTSVQPSMSMPPPCHEDNYYECHGGDTYNTTLYGGRSALELTAFSCHLVNTFRADVCTALEVYDLLLAELLSHTMTSSTAGKYIESKSNPFDLFRGDRLDVMTKNLNATRVLMVKVS